VPETLRANRDGRIAPMAATKYRANPRQQLTHAKGFGQVVICSLLMIVGLYIRLRILETPVFTKVKQEQRIAKAPLSEVVRYHWREILLCTLVRFGETAPFYIFTSFVLSYAIQVDPSLLYTGLAIASLVALVMMPVSAHISDRVGRKRWFTSGTILMAGFAFPYFLLLQTRNPALVLIALIFSIKHFRTRGHGRKLSLSTQA
jgi:Na+/melibiose symporter-like transporter